MKALTYTEMEVISGEGFFNGFCRGVQAATVIYGAGLLANIWNPVGAGSTVGLLIVNGVCIFA